MANRSGGGKVGSQDSKGTSRENIAVVQMKKHRGLNQGGENLRNMYPGVKLTEFGNKFNIDNEKKESIKDNVHIPDTTL